MKKSIVKLFIFFVGLGFFQIASANNLSISNVDLNGQNTASDFTMINFDVSWNNSWRTSVGPSNWDAVWVFAKWRLKTSDVWNHATLHYVDGTGSGDGHTEPVNSNIASSNDNGAGGAYGVFVYRNADMTQSNVNYTGAQLRWDYGVDGIGDADSVEICVFGIEMVYIPQSSFFIGDGLATVGQFEAGLTGVPYQVTSEGALVLGGVGANVGNNNTTGQTAPVDDFNDATSQNLPASYPKGFNDFYVMKYELSQEQYVSFMNKLTRPQQSARMLADAAGEFMRDNATTTTPTNRNGVKIQDNTTALTPRVYGNDLDDDDVFDEAVDGQTIACNWMSTQDAMAYLDWSGLRPITEFEYEKICRGTVNPIAGEYAWGGTGIIGATSITNPGATNELADVTANCTYNNAALVQGPLRVGQFAEAASTRAIAGAGYYGAMDLSGNCWEFCISAGVATGRAFTGTHGDGVLDVNGNRTNADWPSTTTSTGYCLRGAAWNHTVPITLYSVSGRQYSSWVSGGTTRYTSTSCRGGRTAP